MVSGEHEATKDKKLPTTSICRDEKITTPFRPPPRSFRSFIFSSSFSSSSSIPSFVVRTDVLNDVPACGLDTRCDTGLAFRRSTREIASLHGFHF